MSIPNSYEVGKVAWNRLRARIPSSQIFLRKEWGWSVEEIEPQINLIQWTNFLLESLRLGVYGKASSYTRAD